MPSGPRPFPSLISLSLVVAALLCPSTARACKDRMYPATFPVAELHGYAHAYVVRVSRLTYAVTFGQGEYSAPFSFEGTVIRTIKGPRLAGEVIRGATGSGEEAHARCPISLDEGKTYLLMLNGSGFTYALPRYGSLYVSADRPEFEGYVADLTKGSQ
ncbi:hypothetical protein IV454_21080 [Massilia antarctica]|uniref:DUF2846 domain-containing protein n=1 Tax=Massilia antarctica TaxID=2765360 RepID=A0AA48W9X1_9BURK|nr:hypothetical protein [Massilia antarctica]QPI48036.1 hypothetical protein IV454_21080 [Massilia antarctica]